MSHKSPSFRKILITSLRVICCLVCLTKSPSFRKILITLLRVICCLVLSSKILSKIKKPSQKSCPMYLVNVFFLTLITFDQKTIIPNLQYLNCACAVALKIAKILTAQASAQPFKNNRGASAIASKIVAPQACGTSAHH